VSTAWAIIVLVGAAFCTLAISIFHSLLSGEVRAWLPHLARRLVRGAARQLPVDSRARYEADWLAELVAWQDRPMSAFAKAATSGGGRERFKSLSVGSKSGAKGQSERLTCSLPRRFCFCLPHFSW
jgi:hypothetical protein